MFHFTNPFENYNYIFVIIINEQRITFIRYTVNKILITVFAQSHSRFLSIHILPNLRSFQREFDFFDKSTVYKTNLLLRTAEKPSSWICMSSKTRLFWIPDFKYGLLLLVMNSAWRMMHIAQGAKSKLIITTFTNNIIN